MSNLYVLNESNTQRQHMKQNQKETAGIFGTLGEEKRKRMLRQGESVAET